MTLDDDDIEAIAERVALKLQPTRGGLVDAKQLAGMLGVDRTWVYAHADGLGATRLSGGPRGRLRFDVERALNAATDLGARAPDIAPLRSRSASARGPRHELAEGIELLRGRRP